MNIFKKLSGLMLGWLLACAPNASNQYIGIAGSAGSETGDTGYFNINYMKQSEANINDDFPLLMMCEKLYDDSRDTHDGLRSEIPVELTYSGGVGWGAVPTSRSALIQKAQLDHKELFAAAYASSK